MSVDSDLSAALPEPPPPRPARREAAIDAAMRRFDGSEEPPPVAQAAPPHRKSWIGRPQIAAFATVALVAVVGIPVWLTGDHPIPPAAQEAPAPEASEMAESAAETPIYAPAPTATEQPPSIVPADRVARRTPGAPAVDVPAIRQAEPMASAPAPVRTENAAQFADAAPPPPPPPPPAPAAESRAGALASRGFAGESAAQEVVVTGSRVAAPPAKRRAMARQAAAGDWNACTVNDPRRDLNACARQIGSGQIADGLQSAWRGDYDGAIRAFDQAIAAAPGQSLAYLNRGLAHRRQGDLDRALADLDQAVRAAPRSARAYYNRSLILREKGENGRAERDAERAVTLDARYQDVVE